MTKTQIQLLLHVAWVLENDSTTTTEDHRRNLQRLRVAVQDEASLTLRSTITKEPHADDNL